MKEQNFTINISAVFPLEVTKEWDDGYYMDYKGLIDENQTKKDLIAQITDNLNDDFIPFLVEEYSQEFGEKKVQENGEKIIENIVNSLNFEFDTNIDSEVDGRPIGGTPDNIIYDDSEYFFQNINLNITFKNNSDFYQFRTSDLEFVTKDLDAMFQESEKNNLEIKSRIESDKSFKQELKQNHSKKKTP